MPVYSKKLLSPEAVAGLVQVIAHEYFIVAGVEKTDSYDVSSQLMLAMKTAFIDCASLLGPAPKPVQTFIPACSDSSINLRTAPEGFKCLTSKGAIYERVARDNFGEAWKGPDGLIWSNFIGGFPNVGQDQAGKVVDSEATRQCAQIGGKLPSQADFERGEANGFREVLRNMKGRKFWSVGI